MNHSIISLGLDIGTSTTKLILSRLTLENHSPGINSVQAQISKKEVLYRSKIHFTPILVDGSIDFPALKKILDEEMDNSGISLKDILTGAIIITGESSRKYNSRIVLEQLAQYAGEFVVAIAGPEIESLLAGQGSGAAQLARTTGKKVININIGGGTTNIALFEGEHVLCVFALDLGGRLIRIHPESEKIEYLSPRLTPLLEELHLPISLGSHFDAINVMKLTRLMAQILYDIISNNPKSWKRYSDLFITSLPLEKHLKNIEFICFSGGVGEIYNQFFQKNLVLEPSIDSDESSLYSSLDLLRFHDIGLYFALELTNICKSLGEKIQIPYEKILATVIGAGTESLSVSGSTIFIENFSFPLKNVPIIPLMTEPNDSDLSTFQTLIDEMISKSTHYSSQSFAFWIKGPSNPSYHYIKTFAESLCRYFSTFGREFPFIFLLQHDFAQALGQSIKNLQKAPNSLLLLDRIVVRFGDYIDIGKPIMGVVPIVIKTMIFNT